MLGLLILVQMNNMTMTTKRWLLVLVWSLAIFVGSSIPSAQVSQDQVVDFIVHKTIHLIEYGVLAVFVFRACRSFWWTFVFCLFYAFTDETHQLFVLGRQGKFRDVLIDLLGSSLALYILWKYLHLLPRKLRNWLDK